MRQIGLNNGVRGVGLGFLLGLFVFGAAQAQSTGDDGLQYRVIDGQVYAYQANDPASLYRIPNLTPQQVGLGGDADAQERARAAAQARAYNTYPQGQGYGASGYQPGSDFHTCRRLNQLDQRRPTTDYQQSRFGIPCSRPSMFHVKTQLVVSLVIPGETTSFGLKRPEKTYFSTVICAQTVQLVQRAAQCSYSALSFSPVSA